MKYKATILKVKYRFFASCGVMDVTQKEMVEVKQKLLEAANLVPIHFINCLSICYVLIQIHLRILLS